MTSESTESDGTSDPIDLAEWGLHCYCPTARRTPHALVAEGSNGRLLYQARNGVTVSALRSQGIPVGDEQLARLAEFGLLNVDGDALRTAFPVLGRVEITALRRRLRALGERLAARLTPQVEALNRCLERMDLGASGYAVVFGYALDGLLWDRLLRGGAVPETALCEARPWWNGAFWAVHPARPSAAGTNFVPCGDATLVQVWTESTLARLTALATVPGLSKVVGGLVQTDASATSGEVVDSTGVTWRLRRPDGRAAIPVLGGDGPLDALAGPLADVVTEALVGEEAAPARALVPGDDPRVATVVIAHELIWDVTEALVASGTVALAQSLSTVRPAGDALLDLLYLEITG